MTAARDPTAVGRHEDEHLRRFVAARASGDAAAMRRWWGELVVDVFDRMDGFVAAAHRGRLSHDEHDLAVQLAMVRFAENLIRTYRGSSMGELINATRTLAQGICIDVQRRSMARRGHETATLDDGWQGAGDAPPYSWAEGEEARRRHDDEQDARDHLEFLRSALPRLGDNRRRVMQLTLAGADLEEIAAELDTSRDNVYQLRCRAIKDLKKLKEQDA